MVEKEFVVLLPEADIQAATAIAERLRVLFACTENRVPSGDAIRCMVSIGVVECMACDDEVSLVRRADEACYAAKEQGKIRVVTANLPS